MEGRTTPEGFFNFETLFERVIITMFVTIQSGTSRCSKSKSIWNLMCSKLSCQEYAADKVTSWQQDDMGGWGAR